MIKFIGDIYGQRTRSSKGNEAINKIGMTNIIEKRKEEKIKRLIEKRKEEFAKRVEKLEKESQERERKEEKIRLIEEKKEIKQKERLVRLEEIKIKQKERLAKLEERKKEIRATTKTTEKFKTTEEFKFTEEEKEKCRKKTLEELVDEISGSTLTCPPGKEPKKEIGSRELTTDIVCLRKRIRKKSPKEIRAIYDKLLESDPERLCKDKG